MNLIFCFFFRYFKIYSFQFYKMNFLVFYFLGLSYSIVTQCKLMPNSDIKIMPLERINSKNLKGVNDYKSIRINSYYFPMNKIQNNKTIDFDTLLNTCVDTISYFKSLLNVVPKISTLYVQKKLFSDLNLNVPINHCIF